MLSEKGGQEIAKGFPSEHIGKVNLYNMRALNILTENDLQSLPRQNAPRKEGNRHPFYILRSHSSYTVRPKIAYDPTGGPKRPGRKSRILIVNQQSIHHLSTLLRPSSPTSFNAPSTVGDRFPGSFSHPSSRSSLLS